MAPHWMCRLALALVLPMGLMGCSEGEPFEGCVNPFPSNAGPANPGIVRVGELARVFALPVRFQICANTSAQPISASAEITGPGGELLETQVQLGIPSDSVPTAIEFTPGQPGPHHILLEFAPHGGLQQLDVHAARDLSAEAPSQVLSRSCASLERTLQGAWVCDSSVLRGDESLDSFTGARLAVAGEVIWVVDGSTVRRYVDTGTTLTLTGTASRPSGAVDFLLASPNELVVLLHTSLTLFTFQGGVVTAGTTTPWSRPSLPITTDSPYGVLLREGVHLAIATLFSPGTQPIAQVCPYQLLAGRFERTTGDCSRFSGEIIGFEPGVLWTRDRVPSSSTGPTALQFRRWVWADGQLTEQGSLSLGIHVSVASRAQLRSSVVPLVHNSPVTASAPGSPEPNIPVLSSLVTWSPQRKALLLEHLDGEITSGYASPGLYWGVTPSSAPQTTKVRIRPPMP